MAHEQLSCSVQHVCTCALTNELRRPTRVDRSIHLPNQKTKMHRLEFSTMHMFHQWWGAHKQDLYFFCTTRCMHTACLAAGGRKQQWKRKAENSHSKCVICWQWSFFKVQWSQIIKKAITRVREAISNTLSFQELSFSFPHSHLKTICEASKESRGSPTATSTLNREQCCTKELSAMVETFSIWAVKYGSY